MSKMQQEINHLANLVRNRLVEKASFPLNRRIEHARVNAKAIHNMRLGGGSGDTINFFD